MPLLEEAGGVPPVTTSASRASAAMIGADHATSHRADAHCDCIAHEVP
ncbi:hypothetical protein [Microcella alkalica]|nr:hypothetical protein [Microcella alkalica]